MSYAMALDNSWDILSEEEMYDVNSGVSFRTLGFNFWGKRIGTGLGAAAQGIKFGKNYGGSYA